MNRRTAFKSLAGALATMLGLKAKAISSALSAPADPLDQLIPGNEDGFTYRELASYQDLRNLEYHARRSRKYEEAERFYAESRVLLDAARERQAGQKIREQRFGGEPEFGSLDITKLRTYDGDGFYWWFSKKSEPRVANGTQSAGLELPSCSYLEYFRKGTNPGVHS